MAIAPNDFRLIVIGGSAGSFAVVTAILSALPKDFTVPVVMCLHRLKHVRSGFVEALNTKSTIEVVEPNDKEPIKKNKVYLAPANYHLLMELNHTFALNTEDMVKFSRPSIDVTFDSASYVFRDKMLGIILSGANTDGAEGIFKAHQRGACTIVQDPNEAAIPTMPNGALNLFKPTHVFNTNGIVSFLKQVYSDNKPIVNR